MDKKEVNSIGEIITKVSDSVFVNDMNMLALCDKNAKKEVNYLVHFDHLYLAPSGGLVYRGIESECPNGIVNATRGMSKATAPRIDLQVLPQKSKPVGNVVEYFNTKPTKADCMLPTTISTLLESNI